MKCKKCGLEQEEVFGFCPECGEIAQTEKETLPENKETFLTEKLKLALKNPIYLILCILFTVSCGLSLIAGEISVIGILIAIFLWIIFAESQKDLINYKNLQCISGVVYAKYVINNIIGVIYIVCGVIVSIGMVLVMFVPSLEKMLIDATDEINDIAVNLSLKFTGAIGVAVGIFIICGGVVYLLINNLGFKKIHRFVKSVHLSVLNNQIQLANPNAVKNWLIVFGVCAALSGMTSILANIVLAMALMFKAAAIILGAVIIDKYFMPKTQYV